MHSDASPQLCAVFEEAPPLSPAWTPRSYSININARG